MPYGNSAPFLHFVSFSAATINFTPCIKQQPDNALIDLFLAPCYIPAPTTSCADPIVKAVPFPSPLFSIFCFLPGRMRQFPGPVTVLWPFFLWQVIVNPTEDATPM
jgi:hypothetical protein